MGNKFQDEIYIRLKCTDIRVKTNDICALQTLINNETDKNALAVFFQIIFIFLWLCELVVPSCYSEYALGIHCAAFWFCCQFCAPFSIFF
jgi:hypothetical protein